MLTRKQHELLMFIHERLKETGVSPSFDEMKEALDLASKSGIHRLITELEERGFLRRLPHRARALEVVKMPQQATASSPPKGRAPFRPQVVEGVRMTDAAPAASEVRELPVLGRIAAGTPIDAIQHERDRVSVPESMLGAGEHFILEVQGDSMINAGIPTIFLNAADIGYTGCELQDAINGDPRALARFETIRAHGALKMGLIRDVGEAATRQHTPKVAFVAPPACYTASSGKAVQASDVDLLVRALSMGKLHHAMMGTAAVAIGTAAAVPGTLVNLAAGGGPRNAVRFGHPSGTLRVGAAAEQAADGQWTVTKALMSRSARVLMEGWVRVPGDSF